MAIGHRNAASPALVLVCFATIYLVWGSTFLGIKFAIESLPPFTMAGIRFLFAGLVLFAVIRGRVTERPTFRHWVSATIVGTLMLLGGNSMVCWAEQYVASGLAALVLATIPLWFVVFDWLFFSRARPGPRILVGLLAGIAGVVTLVGPGEFGGGGLHVGGAIALIMACASWAFGSLYAQRAHLPRSLFLVTAMEMVAGGVVILTFGAVIGEWRGLDFAAVTVRSWLSVAYLALIGSVVALSAYNFLLSVSTPAKVATYAYVNPVVAMLLGFFFAGEAITARILVAAVAILAAVVLITTARVRAEPAGELKAAPRPGSREARRASGSIAFDPTSPIDPAEDAVPCGAVEP